MWLGFVIAFVAGFVDTATFLAARGLFSAHVTGNFVLFAVAAARGTQEIDYLKLFLFVPFLGAVALVGWLARGRGAARLKAPVFLAVAVLLGVPAIYFAGAVVLPNEFFDVANAVIMMPVFAMGLQSGLQKLLNPAQPATNVMTGNATQMVLDALARGGDVDARRAKAGATLRVVLGFALGCLVGALLVHRFSLSALGLPAVISLVLAFTARQSAASEKAR